MDKARKRLFISSLIISTLVSAGLFLYAANIPANESRAVPVTASRPGITANPIEVPDNVPDTSPPYLAQPDPSVEMKSVPADAAIILTLKDDNAGIDKSSIFMTVNDVIVSPLISGDKKSYNIAYKPDTNFKYEDKVKVTLQAIDLALIPNRFSITYYLTVESRTKVYPPVLNDTGNIRMVVFYYGEHRADTNALITRLKPQYAVVNPPHGLWGETYGYETWWLLQDAASYQEAGIKVIGYLTSGYQGKGSAGGIDNIWSTLETNEKLIRNMATIDNVDGVFIDECDTFPDDEGKAYLKALTDLAHSYGLLTWGNVGLNDCDEWFFTEGGFDMMNFSEEWHGHPLSTVQQKWGDRISVTGAKPDYEVQDAYDLTLEAWQKGLAYAYISNNQYNTMAPWLEELGGQLRKYKPGNNP